MRTIIALVLVFLLGRGLFATETEVRLKKPEKKLTMGDVVAFKGEVVNVGKKNLRNAVVYLSLAFLKKGEEHPVDLEDWSAGRAVRIANLPPSGISMQDWKLRLIQSGDFCVFLTVINPNNPTPTVSPLVKFHILPKVTVSSARILPVAIGMPALVGILLIMIAFAAPEDKKTNGGDYEQ